MDPIDQIEENTINSFSHVRKDIDALYDLTRALRTEVRKLNIENKFLSDELKRVDIKSDIIEISRPVRSVKKVFIGSKQGTKIHNKDCVFGKKIKPKYKIKFNTLNMAIKKGYKKCVCLK